MTVGQRLGIVLAGVAILSGLLFIAINSQLKNERQQEYVTGCTDRGELRSFCECVYNKLNSDLGGKGDIEAHIDTLSESAKSGIVRGCEEE